MTIVNRRDAFRALADGAGRPSSTADRSTMMPTVTGL